MSSIRQLQQIYEMPPFKQNELEHAKNHRQGYPEYGFERARRQPEIDAQGNPSPGKNGNGRGSRKRFHAQVLLDPFEQQLDLPALPITKAMTGASRSHESVMKRQNMPVSGPAYPITRRSEAIPSSMIRWSPATHRSVAASAWSSLPLCSGSLPPPHAADFEARGHNSRYIRRTRKAEKITSSSLSMQRENHDSRERNFIPTEKGSGCIPQAIISPQLSLATTRYEFPACRPRLKQPVQGLTLTNGVSRVSPQ